MKTLIVATLLIGAALADTSSQSTTTTDNNKLNQKTANAIPAVSQKQPQTYYAMPAQQHQSPYYQYVQKPNYIHQQQQPQQLQQTQQLQQPQQLQQQQQPQTIMIIAQPALVPQHILYGGQAAQQLLQYFHSNPQAKYQLLHGYQPHPTAQTYVPQGTQTYAQYSPIPQNYQVLTTIPQQNYPNYIPAPTQIQYTHNVPTYSQTPSYQQQTTATYTTQTPNYSQQQPTTLNQIAQYAALQAQQHSGPIKSAPPIITGFENFTPEQQAQIKQQLSTHFGGNLTPINSNSLNQVNYSTQSENKQESTSASNFKSYYAKPSA